MKHIPTLSRLSFAIPAFARRLARAREGAVAIAFALAFIPLVIAVGVGIDLGRVYLVKERLTHTMDAAGLAIGSNIDTGADLQDVLDKFVAGNFPDGGIGAVTSTSYVVNGDVITVTAQATVQTTFMQIAGVDSITVNASAEITRQDDTLELVLVLDNTLSMNSGGKIDDLKDAANSLVDILFGSDTTSSQVKIGLVPFAATVNIGTSNTTYISDSSGWDGCVQALQDGNDVTDDSSGPWDSFDEPGLGFLGDGCPEPITPLTNVKATLTTAINNMSTTGATHINYGAVWGWRVISSSEPFTEGVTYGTPDNNKAIIILTDGANTYFDSYSAYQDFSDSPSASELDDKLETVCTAMKAEGIIVYTITFDLDDADTQTLFENCATDSDKYYDSPSGSELSRAFRSIAAELKKLRITG